MSRSLLLRLGAVAVLVVLFFLVRGDELRGPTEIVTGPPDPARAEAAEPLASAGVSRPAIGFRSPRDLVTHYARHAAEFGAISKAEYLRRAQELRDRPAGGDVLERVRADGVVTRFDRASGAFLAVDPDGTIRTYFRPAAGEAYFERQARRGSQDP